MRTGDLLEELDLLRAIVRRLPRCGHRGCGVMATQNAEPGDDPRCDAHGDCNTSDVPWAPELRRYLAWQPS